MIEDIYKSMRDGLLKRAIYFKHNERPGIYVVTGVKYLHTETAAGEILELGFDYHLHGSPMDADGKPVVAFCQPIRRFLEFVAKPERASAGEVTCTVPVPRFTIMLPVEVDALLAIDAKKADAPVLTTTRL
jgi:hypothetical protein